jgi:uncharacterized protein YjbI with pentapeptide repeats
VETGNRKMIARVAFFLPALLLSLSLLAEEDHEVVVVVGSGDAEDVQGVVVEEISDDTEGGSVVIVEEVYDDTEGEEQASGCNGPFRGEFVMREMFDQARSQGETNFCKINLSGADLSGVNFQGLDLSGANLSDTILSDAFLRSTNLSGTDLMDADLSGADLAFANLSGAKFEPLPDKLPLLDSLSLADGLSEMHFRQYPSALVSLRMQFRDAGYRDQERQITYALKHSETVKKLEKDDNLAVVDASFNYVLFGLTTKWGLQPWRALLAVLVFIVLFAPAYWWALRNPVADGIWRVWDEFRQRQDLGKSDAERPIQLHGMKAWRLALYFSMGSAFNIGWRELNVGNWISRLQRYEFTYKATGRIRTVSGVQSLLSVYLVAMWALTYFGRPFE